MITTCFLSADHARTQEIVQDQVHECANVQLTSTLITHVWQQYGLCSSHVMIRGQRYSPACLSGVCRAVICMLQAALRPRALIEELQAVCPTFDLGLVYLYFD